MRVSVEIVGYRDLKLIAPGVCSAVQVETGRPVAVLAAVPDTLEAVARLGPAHPHIAAILDTRTLPDGRACLVMDYHEEGSLHDRLTGRGPLPPGDVIAVGVALADALAHAHLRGVVHGNVKPQKVFATRDGYVLAGFGPPGTATVAEDIRALGATLSTLVDQRQVPPALAAIISRCLPTRPGEGFPDAASLRDALSALRVPVAAAPGVWLIPAPSAPAIQPSPPDPTPSLLTPPPPSMPPATPSVSPAVPSLLTPPPPSVPPAAPSVSPAAPGVVDRPGPGWPRLALLTVTALLLGSAVTVGLAWWRGLAVAPATSDAGRPAPSPSGPPPIVVNLGRLNDPAIAPEITGLTDRGTSLVVTWADRSGGRALFVVVGVTGTSAVPLIQVEAGRTEVVVPSVDPAKPSCVAVVAITDTAQAISPLRCRDGRSTSRSG